MIRRVIWTDTALESLQETYRFITEIWNADIAEQLLDRIDLRITQVQENPELAPSLSGTEYRQLIIHESVSLFYKIYPEYIKLLLVWDNRQDPKKLFKKLTSG